MQTFGEQLNTARNKRGMTQDALASAMHVTRQTVSSWERNRTQPDIESVRKLSEILEADLFFDPTEQAEIARNQPLSGDSDSSEADVMESQPPQSDTGATDPSTVESGKKRRVRAAWLLAGAAILVCALVAVGLFSRRGVGSGTGTDTFHADLYSRIAENEAGKAYIALTSRAWEEKGEGTDFQMYAVTLNEQNGIGFTVARIEIQLEGKGGALRSQTLLGSDLQAANLDPQIVPYGALTFDGGFPRGEFLRGGITVYGNDANGAAMTFYHLIEF